jgi:hypothetical protein
MSRKICTRTNIDNSNLYILITWDENEDKLGWTGTTTEWTDKNTKTNKQHVVNLYQTTPIGGICVDIDQMSVGTWSFGSFEGTGLTERDLQWAALYTIEAIKRKEVIDKYYD